jgi:hypothetical protein
MLMTITNIPKIIDQFRMTSIADDINPLGVNSNLPIDVIPFFSRICEKKLVKTVNSISGI